MFKRVIFIGVITLVATSAASAVVMGGYPIFVPWGVQGPHSQQQAYLGYGGQLGAQFGPGNSSGSIGAGVSNTLQQETPVATGTETTTVGNTQSAFIQTGPRSMGATYSDFMFGTYQGQFFLY